MFLFNNIYKNPIFFLLTAVTVNIFLIVYGVSNFTTYGLSMTTLWSETVGLNLIGSLSLLIGYAAFGIGLIIHSNHSRNSTLMQGWAIGVMIGIILVLHLPFESYGITSPVIQRIVDTCTIFTVFPLLGFIAARVYRLTEKIRFGFLASIWSAMIGILIVLIGGFVMNNTFLPYVKQTLQWDFDRSGYHNLDEFVFEYSLQKVCVRLLMAPILGGILGCIGIVVMSMTKKLQIRRHS